ncbi:hypothetical protein [Jeotgalibaca porci]|uniref:hypothetical protein n=1 Tax=Jeotgalibaca porci TaxID=1868793 RepID=UPI0035A09758
MTKILVLEKSEEKLRRERERLLGELSVYGERLAFLQDTVDEIKEMIEYYDKAIEHLGTDELTQLEQAIADEVGVHTLFTKRCAGVHEGKVYTRPEYLLNTLQVQGYKYLARDENSELYAFKEKPKKYESLAYWNAGGSNYSLIKKDNFPEVKWAYDEPTEISELLASYENGGESGK